MSIIDEALRKVAKERDKAKRRPVEPKSSPLESENIKSLSARYVKSKTVIVSGILLLLAIAFLTVTNIFLVPPPGIKETMPAETSGDFIETPVEAEAYTEVRSEIALIEEKVGLMGKMAKAFKIESTQEEFLSNFTLNGIVYDMEDPWAIINNKVVKVGETLDGAAVISIAPQKVVLLFKNERFDLAVK